MRQDDKKLPSRKAIRAQAVSIAVGRNLRLLRLERSCSQMEIGEILGVSFQQIQKYENGKNRLPIEKLYFLKLFYDVPYERFFQGAE